LRKKEPKSIKEVDEDLAAFNEDKVEIVGKTYFRNPLVNQGFYSKKRDGVADPDPKVMEPFVPIPGKPPRKVVIDRQRKLFASLDIEELLLELGINYRTNASEQNPSEWLPLEPFDDLEYDCRLPHEWIELGTDEEGNFAPIPAQGLAKNDDGICEWKAVLVESWDEERA
jgi:dynein heavy chain